MCVVFHVYMYHGIYVFTEVNLYAMVNGHMNLLNYCGLFYENNELKKKIFKWNRIERDVYLIGN